MPIAAVDKLCNGHHFFLLNTVDHFILQIEGIDKNLALRASVFLDQKEEHRGL